MKRIKTAGPALIAVLGLGAMCASGAWGSDLVVTEGGVPVSPGTTVFSHVGFGIAHDNNFNEGVFGELVNNSKPADKVTYGAAREFACDNDYTGCPPGWSLSGGGVSAMTLKRTGKVTVEFAPKVVFSEPSTPGPCVYGFAKATGTFTIGSLFGFDDAVATGKLDKEDSQADCSKTTRVLVGADLEPGGFSSVEFLATELAP